MLLPRVKARSFGSAKCAQRIFSASVIGRPRWERALRKVAKNFDDEDLYGDPMTFTRLPDELLYEASELFQEVIEFETD